MNVRTARIWQLALVLGTSASCAGDPEVEIVEGTAIDHGEALFTDAGVTDASFNRTTCATCHARRAGETDLILPGAPLAGVVSRPSYWGGKEIELLRSINHCLYYFMLQSDPWTSDNPEAMAMYAYLESLTEGPAGEQEVPFTVVVAVTNPPAGDAARGAATYARACANCHGAVGTGAGKLVKDASTLPGEWLDDHPLEEYTPLERRLVFVEKVRHGGFLGYGGEMPPFSLEKLTDQDLGDLLELLGVP
ncbi:c-type cytochrome [Sorangium sp. So ce295]|uniref:c-type cytochrome n=1 Tax=Sorangium sp. So ce295 TaxID=3133295 RepID=UPI003F5F9BBC